MARISLLLLIFILNDHLAYFEFTLEYDEDLVAVFSFLGKHLSTVAVLLVHAQMNAFELVLWQILQEGNLREEGFHFLEFLAIDMVKHILVVSFVHHGECAICQAENTCSTRQDAIRSIHVLGKCELTKCLPLSEDGDWHH